MQEKVSQSGKNKKSKSTFFRGPQGGASFFSPTTIQPKLIIGQANDKYEQEADSISEQVVNRIQTQQSEPVSTTTPSPPIIQTKCSSCEEEERLQKMEEQEGELAETIPDIQKMATLGDEETSFVQPSIDGTLAATPMLQRQLNANKGQGNPLPENTLSEMEQALNNDFSDVRIHNNDTATQMNQGLRAKAFTHGTDIYFKEGQYDPGSSAGKRLLAHELVHVGQQGSHSSVNNEEGRIQLQQENEAPSIPEIVEEYAKLTTIDDLKKALKAIRNSPFYVRNFESSKERLSTIAIIQYALLLKNLEFAKMQVPMPKDAAKYQVVSYSLRRLAKYRIPETVPENEISEIDLWKLLPEIKSATSGIEPEPFFKNPKAGFPIKKEENILLKDFPFSEKSNIRGFHKGDYSLMIFFPPIATLLREAKISQDVLEIAFIALMKDGKITSGVVYQGGKSPIYHQTLEKSKFVFSSSVPYIEWPLMRDQFHALQKILGDKRNGAALDSEKNELALLNRNINTRTQIGLNEEKHPFYDIINPIIKATGNSRLFYNKVTVLKAGSNDYLVTGKAFSANYPGSKTKSTNTGQDQKIVFRNYRLSLEGFDFDSDAVLTCGRGKKGDACYLVPNEERNIDIVMLSLLPSASSEIVQLPELTNLRLLQSPHKIVRRLIILLKGLEKGISDLNEHKVKELGLQILLAWKVFIEDYTTVYQWDFILPKKVNLDKISKGNTKSLDLLPPAIRSVYLDLVRLIKISFTIQEFRGQLIPALAHYIEPRYEGKLSTFIIDRTNAITTLIKSANELLTLLSEERLTKLKQRKFLNVFRDQLNPYDIAFLRQVILGKFDIRFFEPSQRNQIESLFETQRGVQDAVGLIGQTGLFELLPAQGQIKLRQLMTPKAISKELYGPEKSWKDYLFPYNRGLLRKDQDQDQDQDNNLILAGVTLVVDPLELVEKYRGIFLAAQLAYEKDRPGNLYIKARPSATAVPGNTVTYSLEASSSWPIFNWKSTLVSWWIEYDPHKWISYKRPLPAAGSYLQDEFTKKRREKKFRDNQIGTHKIWCLIMVDNQVLYKLNYTQVVMPLEEKTTIEFNRQYPTLSNLNQLQLDLEADLKELPETEQNKEQRKTLGETINKIKEAKKEGVKYPIRAVYVSADEQPTAIALPIFIGMDKPRIRDRNHKYFLRLWDFNFNGRLREYHFSGKELRGTLLGLLEKFADDAPYPTGNIRFQINRESLSNQDNWLYRIPPSMGGLIEEPVTYPTNGGWLLDDILRGLSTLAFVIAVGATILMQPEIATPAFWLSAILAGTAAGIEIYDRKVHGDLRLDEQTAFDILDIAGALVSFGTASIVTKSVRGVENLTTIERIARRIPQGLDGIEITLMAGIHISQLEVALKNKDSQRAAQTLLKAIADGTLLIVIHRSGKRRSITQQSRKKLIEGSVSAKSTKKADSSSTTRILTKEESFLKWEESLDIDIRRRLAEDEKLFQSYYRMDPAARKSFTSEKVRSELDQAKPIPKPVIKAKTVSKKSRGEVSVVKKKKVKEAIGEQRPNVTSKTVGEHSEIKALRKSIADLKQTKLANDKDIALLEKEMVLEDKKAIDFGNKGAEARGKNKRKKLFDKQAEAAQRRNQAQKKRNDLLSRNKKIDNKITSLELKLNPDWKSLIPCFSGDTLIYTTEGCKRIDELVVGDSIMSFDFSSDKAIPRTVLEVFVNKTHHFYEVNLADDRILATGSHRFWVDCQQKWIPACKLEKNMKLRLINGEITVIDSIRLLDDLPSSTTYNLRIEKTPNYFVGSGVLVHNQGVPEYEFGDRVIYEGTNPKFPEKIYIGQTSKSDFDDGTREKNHRAEARKNLQKPTKLTAKQKEFNEFMKNIRLTVRVKGLNEDMAHYLEQVNMAGERKIRGEDNLMNRREQRKPVNMSLLKERIINDPDVKKLGYCPRKGS